MFDGNEFDLKHFPTDHALAYHRPDNELLFVRGIEHIWLGREVMQRLRTSELELKLNEYFASLLIKKYERLLSELRKFVDVVELSKFEVDVVNEDGGDGPHAWGSIQRIEGIRIYDVEQREYAQESEWLEMFGAEYGLEVEDFLKVWSKVCSKNRRHLSNGFKYFDEEVRGFDSPLAKKIMLRLVRKHDWVTRQVLSEGDIAILKEWSRATA